MHDEQALREACERFERACKAVLESMRDGHEGLGARIEEAQAALRQAQEALAAARVRNGQTKR